MFRFQSCWRFVLVAYLPLLASAACKGGGGTHDALSPGSYELRLRAQCGAVGDDLVVGIDRRLRVSIPEDSDDSPMLWVNDGAKVLDAKALEFDDAEGRLEETLHLSVTSHADERRFFLELDEFALNDCDAQGCADVRMKGRWEEVTLLPFTSCAFEATGLELHADTEAPELRVSPPNRLDDVMVITASEPMAADVKQPKIRVSTKSGAVDVDISAYQDDEGRLISAHVLGWVIVPPGGYWPAGQEFKVDSGPIRDVNGNTSDALNDHRVPEFAYPNSDDNRSFERDEPTLWPGTCYPVQVEVLQVQPVDGDWVMSCNHGGFRGFLRPPDDATGLRGHVALQPWDPNVSTKSFASGEVQLGIKAVDDAEVEWGENLIDTLLEHPERYLAVDFKLGRDTEDGFWFAFRMSPGNTSKGGGFSVRIDALEYLYGDADG